MKKFAVVSVVAVLAAAGAAQAQLAGATLTLRIIPVAGDVGTGLSYPGVTNVANPTGATVLASDSNRTRRFEVQYHVVDPSGNFSNLSSFQMNITAVVSGGTIPNSTTRAALTLNQGNGNASATSAAIWTGAADNSGAPTGTFNGVTGLHRIYRGGMSPASFAGDTLPSNGTPVAGGINLVTPLILNSSIAQDSATGWYSLYSFQVNVGASNLGTDPDNDGFATITLTAATVADSQTQNRWGGYTNDGDPVPRTSTLAVNGVNSFRVEIPAPGSLALVGLGGLVAARRRRA